MAADADTANASESHSHTSGSSYMDYGLPGYQKSVIKAELVILNVINALIFSPHVVPR
ncbi:hypothetical protein UA08_04138 [Talaromyces atroroseus]|uniref:Uncharacterized protein n=1 Tax=Talaromyces atroroseus TaxID=1441469 RepID=A0A1Q5Q8M7_TALAT|nr:hypothetical protein UA08_04138 [Talaromyces atroroseus]OKL60310.1 hypothetical protein UA08_04138 [Talaromyces atroroseus]